MTNSLSRQSNIIDDEIYFRSPIKTIDEGILFSSLLTSQSILTDVTDYEHLEDSTVARKSVFQRRR